MTAQTAAVTTGNGTLQGLKKLQYEMISGAHHLYSDKATLQKLMDAGAIESCMSQVCEALIALYLCNCKHCQK